DGIRDATVTGVQTCALPIYRRTNVRIAPIKRARVKLFVDQNRCAQLVSAGKLVVKSERTPIPVVPVWINHRQGVEQVYRIDDPRSGRASRTIKAQALSSLSGSNGCAAWEAQRRGKWKGLAF